MTIAVGAANVDYAPILFATSGVSVVSQISFDIRDFIPGGIKPNLSFTGLYGFLFDNAGTIRLGDTTPNDSLGINGDWFVVGSGTVYQKIDGHYVDVTASVPIGGATVTFTYQGWRAIGTVTGRCVTGPVRDQIISSMRSINATSTFTGDISY